MREIDSDVLVIGGGGAAARAALEAHKAGASVTLAVKGRFGMSGIRGSGATGTAGPLHLFNPPKKIVKSGDDPTQKAYLDLPDMDRAQAQETFYQRLIQSGLGMADRHMCRITSNEGPDVADTMNKWGLILEESPNMDILVGFMPGMAHMIKSIPQINVLEQIMVTDLLVQDGVCVGAVGLEEASGNPIVFKVKSTILATGGNGQLYMHCFQPSCVTGDGTAMGYEAGAQLMNMEFGQAFVATVYPSVNIMPYPVWKLRPRILNGNGDEFIQNYLPEGAKLSECMEQKLAHGPFSSRDITKYIDIAMIKETKAGRADEHNAFKIEIGPDFDFVDEAWHKEWLEYRGIDWSKEYLEVNIAYQCSNGGLKINENGETSIPCLYAVGETAAGPYGADRPGGSMVTSCQVFGSRAGKHAAAKAKGAKGLLSMDRELVESKLKRIDSLRKCNGNQKPRELLNTLKRKAWENLLLVRSEESLIELLENIKDIRNKMTVNLSVDNTRDLIKALELNNLLQVGEIIAKVSLMRTESRGGHYREDFPERDDTKFLRAITIKRVQDEMEFDWIERDSEWKDKAKDLDGLWWG